MDHISNTYEPRSDIKNFIQLLILGYSELVEVHIYSE